MADIVELRCCGRVDVKMLRRSRSEFVEERRIESRLYIQACRLSKFPEDGVETSPVWMKKASEVKGVVWRQKLGLQAPGLGKVELKLCTEKCMTLLWRRGGTHLKSLPSLDRYLQPLMYHQTRPYVFGCIGENWRPNCCVSRPFWQSAVKRCWQKGLSRALRYQRRRFVLLE